MLRVINNSEKESFVAIRKEDINEACEFVISSEKPMDPFFERYFAHALSCLMMYAFSKNGERQFITLNRYLDILWHKDNPMDLMFEINLYGAHHESTMQRWPHYKATWTRDANRVVSYLKSALKSCCDEKIEMR